MKITNDEIEAAKSPRGGWTKMQLARWGVEWPPPKGWREKLLRGEAMDAPKLIPSPIRPDIPAHELLHQVAIAVINANQAHILWEYPLGISRRAGLLRFAVA